MIKTYTNSLAGVPSRILMIFVLSVFLAGFSGFRAIYAQTVTGTVYDADDETPLAGVNIIEVGTQNGTSTDADGEFSLTVSDANASLRITFIGYQAQTIPLNGRTELEIFLQTRTEALEGVVVTALGIERESKSLGYSVTEVEAADLVAATEANTANLLQGQVAGVVVSPTSAGVGSSTRLTIRGASSLAGDNQPLYVVDGVPIDNSNIGAAGMWGGFDGGDGISSINSTDIKSISVLKGASAAALYGTRARDGVVLITTKSGEGSQGGPTVTFNTTTTFKKAMTGFEDFQNEYGQGTNGVKPSNQVEALSTGQSSWGAPLDGSSVIQFDGVERPYSDQGNPLEAFYRLGFSSKNTLSLAGGNESSSYYFSTTQFNTESVVPNSDLERTSINLRGTYSFGDLTADVKANYINELANNRSWISDTPGNANATVAVLPPNVNVEDVKNSFMTAAGTEQGISDNIFGTNPYWVTNQYSTDDDKDRVIGHIQLDYALADWLSLTGRSGMDWYTLRRTNLVPWGTAYRPDGSISENEYRVLEHNTDIFLHANRQLGSSLAVNATFGGHQRSSKSETVGASGSVFKIPKFRTITNMVNVSPVYAFSEKKVNSLYGAVDLSYNDYLFLSVTGRNDWSSTLPEDGNAFFYPSVSASFVFSEAFSSMPSWLSFGKLRASWAEVGSDTDPYQLSLTYSVLNGSHQGQPLAVIAQTSVPLADLKPTSTVETEAGFDLRFFDDRLSFDFSWYDRQTTNQILSTVISGSSGYVQRVINAGRLDNSGIELLVRGVPFSKTDMFWETSINYSRNKGEVVALAGDQEVLLLEESRSRNTFITAEVGEEYGTIWGYEYMRDANGNIVHENGLPVRNTERVVLGRGTPDWTAGWSNTFSYKTWSVNVLIDARWGAQLYSYTNGRAYGNGLHKNTLVGRAECDAVITPTGYPDTGCFVAEGVDINGGPNTTAVTPGAYYGNIGGNISEDFIYDANFIKLRQLQISYQLPQALIAKLPVQSATVSATGRNLFYIYDPVPNVDPEASINRGNGQGLELYGVPNARTFGLGINLRF